MYTKRYKSAAIWGKLRVCRYLTGNESLRASVPHSKLLTPANLAAMAEAHDAIYVKPDIGSMGIGIHKLVRTANGFMLHSTQWRRQVKREAKDVKEAYRLLRGHGAGRMLIQAAIAIDHVDDQPYDIRVMVQRRPGGPWTCTGFMAKIGGSGSIVTNYYQGGQIWTLERLLREKGYDADKSRTLTEQLTVKALETAHWLSGKKQGMREMGIDFAYDRDGKLWVLEVNSNHPQFHPLKKLDRAAYQRMMSFARAYGRYDAQ
ncbi:YheC/YheD family protein (plasmid) [Paenibacillus cellulosilyticus]|nr:YheC/YheD family protein [Paenibacillus cellulosilyticus]QKS48133.1 YheC/YheD family protein [Paenibacillus cellulosilyticus]